MHDYDWNTHQWIGPLCRDQWELFFPPPDDSKTGKESPFERAYRIEQAKKICTSGCPDFDACLELGIELEVKLTTSNDAPGGVWAGKTRRELKAIDNLRQIRKGEE